MSAYRCYRMTRSQICVNEHCIFIHSHNLLDGHRCDVFTPHISTCQRLNVKLKLVLLLFSPLLSFRAPCLGGKGGLFLQFAVKLKDFTTCRFCRPISEQLYKTPL
ncbi:hypothetical protein XENOCAPTIV_022105 [Xenoophorus captivus]|uniref:Uncharacterized protein n=1 Tax=Xenoophorus captivus TaxID=1517983 RepID=A0ABV0QNY1_9TELE